MFKLKATPQCLLGARSIVVEEEEVFFILNIKKKVISPDKSAYFFTCIEINKKNTHMQSHMYRCRRRKEKNKRKHFCFNEDPQNKDVTRMQTHPVTGVKCECVCVCGHAHRCVQWQVSLFNM